MLKWSRQVTMVARTQAGAEGRCWSGAKHLAGWGGGALLSPSGRDRAVGETWGAECAL